MRVGLREVVFSANCFAAAMLALYVSFALGLERPFWAMATVYITSQPLSGAVRSKAVFRLIGTLVGASAAVVMVPLLVGAPLLLSLALAGWVAACQFVSLLDRTPRSYLFMLAGYTAALVGFPTVGHPEAIFDVAVLRAQEIGIGVTCAALVHAAIWPRSVTALLGARVRTLLTEAERWIADALAPAPTERADQERRRLAADVTELHVMATHVPFDTAAARPTRALLSALQDRFVLLLPLVSAVEDRLRAIAVEGEVPAEVAALVDDIRGWASDADAHEPASLVARADALAAALTPTDWRELLIANLLDRLRELVEALDTARLVAAQAIAPDAAPPERVLALLSERRQRPLHRDLPLALLSAVATFAAILACCGFWIMTAWPEGAVAAMIAAVVCCFFATMDDPVPAQRGFLIWTVASLPLVALYLFALLPLVHSFETLALLLAPALLVPGVLMALPRWYGRMMPLLIGLAGGLALTNSFTADAAGFFNGSVAQLAGVAAAMVATRLCRSLGAGAALRRLRRAGWRELVELAARPGRAPLPAWRSRMLDRVGLLGARVGDLEQGDRDAGMAALRELRVGVNLAQLAPANDTADDTLAALRADVAAHYRARARGEVAAPDAALLARLDAAISTALAEAPAPRDRLAALTGLRRNFFPAARGLDHARAAA
ncbi:FUSC family protein [Sphingomonas sp. BK069]|uniref:FUSC family protein n=1 Tax=Sphingomonas sp. BK069 TaxID=2586979 RepID=UPI001611A3DA|nr:FUSC family protein [Sphingomonas sp. BK069]MBB3348463.1 putative membrane protein YccC [Sphingomonas sp. BK069]